MFRIQQEEHQNRYCRDAHVTHAAGAATGMQAGKHKSGVKPTYWYESWCMYHLKTGGRRRLFMASFARRLGRALNILISAMRRRSIGPLRIEREKFSRSALKRTMQKMSL